MTENKIVGINENVQEPRPRLCEYKILFKWHNCETRWKYRAIFYDHGGLVGGYSFCNDEDEPQEAYCGLQPVAIPGVCPIFEITPIEEEKG